MFRSQPGGAEIEVRQILGGGASSRSAASSWRRSAITTARLMRFSNSRTLPGQSWRHGGGRLFGETADVAAELLVERFRK